MAVRSIIEAIPAAHRSRFATASDIRKAGAGNLHKALAFENQDMKLQLQVQQEINKRIKYLGSCITLPQEINSLGVSDRSNSIALADTFFNFQRDVIEMPNRLSDKEFTPMPRTEMMPFTYGLLKDDDKRKGMKPLFESPGDFLEKFDAGLEKWKHNENSNSFGSVGILDVSGGAGTRAGKELLNYSDYARKHDVTPQTPRSLYPIPNSGKTFKGILVNVIRKISGSIGVRTPHFIMNSFASAPFFSNYITDNPEAHEWGDDIICWNQRVLQRYDIADVTKPLPGLYPAGHGDNATLSYQYGILEAMKNLGIKTIASSNGDEFLWYYLFPALLEKFGSTESAMFAVAIANANNQSGGYFGNGELIETPKIPYSYVRGGKNPEVLNSTFYGLKVESLINGAKFREGEILPTDILSKSACVQVEEDEKFINMLGFDSWMGDEFSKMITADAQKLQVFEGPRNIFLGMKGPQMVANHTPQKFLNNNSYSTFYTMMAHKVFAVLDILLAKDKSAKEALAEKLFKSNFELIDVQI